MSAKPDPAPAFHNGFEDAQALAGATVAGQVTISQAEPFRGTSCLLVQRGKAEMERQPASVVMPAFAVKPGLWDLSVALRSRLYSPDSSYNGTVALEVLDAAGTALERREVGIITADSAWRMLRKRIELPPEAVGARFTISMEKTWGEFAVDELGAAYAGPSLRTVTAITFASDAVGNLFLPGQPIRFTVTAECTQARPKSQRSVTCVVRDYWGAEFATRTVALTTQGGTTKGRPAYIGFLDLSDMGAETGKYYEIHAEMSEPALPEPARDNSAFAVLPVAVTKQHKPFDIPFTASGWNPGVPDFFPLCDRLGMRVANVYSRWSPEPPYNFTAPGLEVVKKLGMGALLGTPVHHVETRGKGFEAYTETALREGARRLVSELKDQLPIAVRVGNEPHPTDDDDVRRMIAAYRAVYQGVKSVDPSIIVTGTSCGPEEAFFRLGYQEWQDVYIFHQYADAQVINGDFARYEALVKQYGQRRPVWSTELGLNSQGMSRGAVAIQLIKVFTNFFACGGVNASWFGIMWPDPDGRIAGSNGDSFDVFNSKYCLYNPKITAIAEYHTVNAICVKKVMGQQVTPDGAILTLFRDSEHRCLLVAWQDAGRQDAFIPLPGVGAVRATRLDGAGSDLEAGGEGITLTLTDEPYLLEFTSADFALPEKLDAPRASLTGGITAAVKGVPARITITGPAAGGLLTAPPGWQVKREGDAFVVTPPAATAAKEGRLLAPLGARRGELQIALPVVDALDARFVPVALNAQGAGMSVRLANRGRSPQKVRWSVAVGETIPMANGTFRLNDPAPFSPEFTTPSAGEVDLAAGAATELIVRVGNLDPHSLYRARLELVSDGRTVSRERLFGGCPGVPKVSGGVTFDGKMGDPAWQKAVAVTLDKPGQFAVLNAATASWDGPEDLSGAMHLMWDEKHLYLGMKVKDDVYCQPEVDANIWRGDGLQFLIDPCRDSDDKPGKYDYTVALSSKGAQAWCYSSADAARAPSEEVKDFGLRITRTGSRGDMVYELAIPWHRVSPFKPAPGANLGLAMIINNDDGKIRDSFMAWFGCAHSKQMSMNGDLILLG